MVTELIGYLSVPNSNELEDVLSSGNIDFISKSDSDGNETWVSTSDENIKYLLDNGYISLDDAREIKEKEIDNILFY